MPSKLQREDLRVVKTYRSLRSALVELLERRSFARVTINDLCEEAQISRATFYAHFRDKYDLLEHCLGRLRERMEIRNGGYEAAEAAINGFIQGHKRAITNLIRDANQETFDLLLAFSLSLLDIPAVEDAAERKADAQTVLSTFCAGGLFNLLLWQVRNRFPSDMPLMNTFTFEMLMALLRQARSEGERDV